MNDENWNGAVQGASGREYNTAVEGVRPGQAPPYIWLAMEHDEIPKGRVIVALVGRDTETGEVARECRLVGVARIQHMVMVLGTWPYARMEEVVRSLNGTGPRQWARRVRRDRDRKDWVPSAALVNELISIYVDQVQRFGPQETR